MANESDTVINEGWCSTTLSHEGFGWNYAVSIRGVLWAKGWVRGDRNLAYTIGLQAAIRAEDSAK